MFNDRRAISAVVSVVVLAGLCAIVSLAYAVTLSGWISEVSTSGTAFATLEVEAAYACHNGTSWNGSSGWIINIHLKNSGSANTSIDNILINGKSLEEYSDNARLATAFPLRISSGNNGKITVELKDGNSFNAGTIIKFELVSSSGASLTVHIDLR